MVDRRKIEGKFVINLAPDTNMLWGNPLGWPDLSRISAGIEGKAVAAQHMAFTIGPHQATSTTPSKVNSFHIPPSFGYHVNGILLETRAHAMTRTMTMTPRDDKRTPVIKTPKQEAWKRRRKKLLKLDRSLRSRPESPVYHTGV